MYKISKKNVVCTGAKTATVVILNCSENNYTYWQTTKSLFNGNCVICKFWIEFANIFCGGDWL